MGRDASEIMADPKDVDVRRCFVVYAGENDYGIWVKGKVQGQNVTVALSNNSDNFVTRDLVQRLGISTSKCKPFKIETPFHVSDSVCGDSLLPNLELELDCGYKSTMDFAVMDLPHHDMLLGFPFFRDSGLLQFGSEMLTIGPYSCKIYQGPPPA